MSVSAIRSVASFVMCLSLSACGSADDARVTDQFPALGTLIEITLRDAGAGHQDVVLREVRDVFDRAQHQWHAWGEGELGQVNAALAAGGPVDASPGLDAMLRRAAGLEAESGGLFNPMVGWLVEAWGFHLAERPDSPPPGADELTHWLSLGLDLARVLAWQEPDPARGEFARIDLGAFAKGVAVEAARTRLREHGIEHAIINAGGDIAVLGHAGTRPWRIGIRDPRGPGVLAGVELGNGEVIFTSGDYERAFEHEGERHHHILDPRTGEPARGTISMTVVHDDPVRADAAATALFVAGDEWVDVARKMGIDMAMRVDAHGDIGILHPLAGRVHFEREPADISVFHVEAR